MVLAMVKLKSYKITMKIKFIVKDLNTSSDGRVVRASALGVEDLGLIPSRVKPMTLTLVFTASLLDAQH